MAAGKYATAASQQDILFGQHFGQINDRLTNIGNGICSLGYDMQGNIAGLGKEVALGQANLQLQASNNAVIIGTPGCPCVSEPACGYYTVSVNTTLVASAAGAVTVSLYQDGQLVPGAVQSATAAAENDMMNFAITAPVRVYRGQTSSKLQIYVNSQQVNTMNVAITT